MINVNDYVHGFKVKEITEIADIEARLVRMEHEKSGARLLFLDREDDNKTFSIAFKTIPEDSTGVFHIIEHSVLCGSEKYPVKEPFVELLKGSLQTFLNAMTFPDKTMYPISTRNDKDYLNLISVYMDAVLHPAILKDPNIFRQEGWHYEIGEDGELSRSGVVLNEMRGAFSSADELEMYHVTDMLYAGTCYSYESGGEPQHITDLSYEEFVAAHKKYYHPSNSEIFIDGSVDLDATLSLLDSFLSDYERQGADFEIGDVSPSEAFRRAEYEISENESAENKTRVAIGYISSRFDEQKKALATSILFDAIASTNESPLKKEILLSGLCEELSILPYDSVKENSLILEFRNVPDGKEDELIEFFSEKVKALVSSGIDKELLEAALNSQEFKMREKDFGTLPRGIIYAMSTLETSLYGGDPAQNLSFSKSFAELREALSGDYYEKLLSELILENPHRATLVMTASPTLGAMRAEAERRELSDIKSGMTDAELRRIRSEAEALEVWQKTPDSEEAVATIPMLSREDIAGEPERVPTELSDECGVKVVSHPLVTDGITYTDLYFDVSDLTPEEIFDLRLLVALTLNVGTEDRSAIELQNLIKKELGSFDLRVSVYTAKSEAKIYAVVSSSVLDVKKNSLFPILEEVIYKSLYTDREVLRNILRQMKMESEDSFVSSGNMAGFIRASAGMSVEGAVQEYYSGYEAHLSIKALDRSFDKEADSTLQRISSLAKRIFVRERLTLSVTGARDAEFSKKLVSVTRCGGTYDPVCKIKPFGVRKEGILIPAQVAFAECAANLSALGECYTGSMNVVRTLLSYSYLWNEVRVQGGAYGVGLIARNNGNLSYYSYRDPSPARTVGCYRGAADFLRAFAESGEDITKFIIGAVGDAEPLMTPRLKGSLATVRYLRGISDDDARRTREQLVATDKAELIRIADILDKLVAEGSVCIVGGKDKLDACKEIIDTVLEI